MGRSRVIRTPLRVTLTTRATRSRQPVTHRRSQTGQQLITSRQRSAKS